MNDNQLIRYSRHILLPQIGIEGQEKLLHSHALIIGAGGLGSPAALYLAAGGVGKITICDGEKVDLTNLQRQIVHHTLSVGTPKTQSARNTLGLINPEVTVVEVPKRVTREDILDLVRSADVVLDASDNFATRHAVNSACVAHRKPLVSGAGVRFDGQVAVFDLRETSSPCYHCLFPEEGEVEETRCAVMGVFAPLTGIIGTIQAAEALKLLTDTGETLNGRLLLLDALSMEWRSIKLAKDPQCSVCGRKANAVNA
ncbi:MAG TPA: HesA/MoeB/ThiF family protein [Burkholderiales bacterium]|nr:HesA/MoeB/ThiF family protein [Burkholderiales bacterium]